MTRTSASPASEASVCLIRAPSSRAVNDEAIAVSGDPRVRVTEHGVKVGAEMKRLRADVLVGAVRLRDQAGADRGKRRDPGEPLQPSGVAGGRVRTVGRSDAEHLVACRLAPRARADGSAPPRSREPGPTS